MTRRRAAGEGAGAASCRRAIRSIFVEAEAALALGRTRSPLALELLPTLFRKPSFQDVLARAPSRGWADRSTSARFRHQGEWRAGEARSSRGARSSSALAELATRHAVARAARESIEECLATRDFRVRGEAATALGRLGLAEAVPAIERALAGELDGRARRRMNDAIRDAARRRPPRRAGPKLHDEVERLRGETASLRERLDRSRRRAPPARARRPPGPSAPRATAPGPSRGAAARTGRSAVAGA